MSTRTGTGQGKRLITECGSTVTVQATVARCRLPAPVFRTMAATATGGRIVIYGGAATTVHTAVQSSGSATGVTPVTGSLPGPSAYLAAATTGGRTVLLGRFDGSGPLNSILTGNGATGSRTLTRLPQAVRYPAVAVSGGDVYLFGGLLSGGEYAGTFTPLIQQVDAATGTARIAGWLPYPVAHAKAIVLDGQTLILAGSIPRGPTSGILRFDPARRAITHADHCPHPALTARWPPSAMPPTWPTGCPRTSHSIRSSSSSSA